MALPNDRTTGLISILSLGWRRGCFWWVAFVSELLELIGLIHKGIRSTKKIEIIELWV